MTSSSGPFRRGNLRQRLYCLFLFSPGTCPPASPPSVLLTWFHDLPLLGDIIDFSLHSPLCAWEYFHLSQGLWASLLLLIPASFLLLRGFVCDPGLCYAPQPFHSWACWAHLLWRASSPQWVPVISAAWDACVTSLTQDRIHLPPFLSHADENPPFILLAMHPSQSPAGQSYRLLSEEGVLSLPPCTSVQGNH